MVVTNEEILKSFQGESELQNLVEILKDEDLQENFKQVVETIKKLFTQQGQSKEKYFAMKLMMLLSKKQKFLNQFIKAKDLFVILEELALCDKQKPYEKRGFQIFGAEEDPNFSHMFYDTLMECISFWGTKYEMDSKGNATIFLKLLEGLHNQGLTPKVDLQYFELTEEQREKLKNYTKPTEYQKQKNNMNDVSLDELKRIYQEMYKQTNEIVETLELNVKGEEQATEVIDQILELAFKEANEIKLNLDLLNARQNEFGEGQRKQIGYRFKMITNFIEAYKKMKEQGFTDENYQIFRYELLLATREISGSEKPQPPKNLGKPAQQQQQQINKQPEQNVQQQQIPKPPQYSDRRQPQPQQVQQQPTRKLPEIQKSIQQSTPYHPQTQQAYQPQTQVRAPQPQQQYQPPRQQIQPYQPPPKQVQPPAFKKLPTNRSQHEHIQTPNKGQFDDQYDNRSQSSQFSGKDFYLKGQLGIISKTYEGQFIPYDDRNFSIFEEIYNNTGINRIKRANLKKKYSIFESSDIQIGFDSNLVYHDITNRYYLRIRLCFGNKTQSILQNFQYSFEGEQCMGLWSQEPIHQHDRGLAKDQQGRILLNPGQQMYIPICINYNRVPYESISAKFSYENEEEQKTSSFIIPCLLTKFMSFRETTIESFQKRWEYKSKSILKSEQVTLNPKIIKSKEDFVKLFGEYNILVLSGQQTFLKELNNEMEGYEFGLVFTLSSPQIEFLLKIIVFPNQTVLFQIIPYSSYQTQAEAFLHTLIFIFCLPD